MDQVSKECSIISWINNVIYLTTHLSSHCHLIKLSSLSLSDYQRILATLSTTNFDILTPQPYSLPFPQVTKYQWNEVVITVINSCLQPYPLPLTAHLSGDLFYSEFFGYSQIYWYTWLLTNTVSYLWHLIVDHQLFKDVNFSCQPQINSNHLRNLTLYTHTLTH